MRRTGVWKNGYLILSLMVLVFFIWACDSIAGDDDPLPIVTIEHDVYSLEGNSALFKLREFVEPRFDVELRQGFDGDVIWLNDQYLKIDAAYSEGVQSVLYDIFENGTNVGLGIINVHRQESSDQFCGGNPMPEDEVEVDVGGSVNFPFIYNDLFCDTNFSSTLVNLSQLGAPGTFMIEESDDGFVVAGNAAQGTTQLLIDVSSFSTDSPFVQGSGGTVNKDARKEFYSLLITLNTD